MGEAKPTPGPWLTHREGFSTIYIQASIGGGWVQEIAACGPTNEGGAQQEANARLIADAGTVFHTTGLTPSQLVERVKELEEALRKYEDVRDDMFTFFMSNGIFNQWGKRYDCSALNNAHLQASAALAKARPNTAGGEAPSEADREELEAVIACLGDDAATLREQNPECEMAANMDRAAELLAAAKEPSP